jgi:hypothetical protein
MIPEIYKVKEFNENFLAIMAKPRGNDWLEDEIKGLSILQVNVLVSLLKSDEVYELGLKEESDICKLNDIEFISFPIEDRGIPSSLQNIVKLVEYLYSSIIKHKKM